MFCTKCGKKITSGAEFCGFCGTPITPEQQEIRDSNQNINQAQSGYPSDWSNEAQPKYSSDWSDNNNEQYDSRLDRREKHEPPQIKKDNKKGFYIFILILTPIVFFVKGGGIYGLTYTLTQSLILLAITSIPIKILRLVLFIIFGFFFLVSGLTPP